MLEYENLTGTSYEQYRRESDHGRRLGPKKGAESNENGNRKDEATSKENIETTLGVALMTAPSMQARRILIKPKQDTIHARSSSRVMSILPQHWRPTKLARESWVVGSIHDTKSMGVAKYAKFINAGWDAAFGGAPGGDENLVARGRAFALLIIWIAILAALSACMFVC